MDGVKWQVGHVFEYYTGVKCNLNLTFDRLRPIDSKNLLARIGKCTRKLSIDDLKKDSQLCLVSGIKFLSMYWYNLDYLDFNASDWSNGTTNYCMIYVGNRQVAGVWWFNLVASHKSIWVDEEYLRLSNPIFTTMDHITLSAQEASFAEILMCMTTDGPEIQY